MARSDGALPSLPELARFAQHLADPSRAAMMMALMDGRAWTVGELAHQAGIARNTASEHLTRLTDAGLISQTRQGRHSYLRLAGQPVADVLESMCRVAGVAPAAPSLRGQRRDAELAEGRTCYHHLAGRLGVGLVDRWLADGVIAADWTITDAGAGWFAGIEVGLPTGSGPVLRPCLDWTERRPHAAGPLATDLAARAFDRGWVERGHHPRSAHLTPQGREALGLS